MKQKKQQNTSRTISFQKILIIIFVLSNIYAHVFLPGIHYTEESAPALISINTEVVSLGKCRICRISGHQKYTDHLLIIMK